MDIFSDVTQVILFGFLESEVQKIHLQLFIFPIVAAKESKLEIIN